jgi:hypothetical protein
MNYFITRDGQQYGPYSLADLQRYVASGEIQLTDMARSEGMSEALPVSQVIGTILVPQAQVPAAPVIGGPINPDPPNLHWGLVLLFGVLSCGLFNAVWNLVQAAWMKRVAPQSRALFYYIGAVCVLAGISVVSFQTARLHSPNPSGGGLNLIYGIAMLVGRFSLRSSLEEYYTSVEPMGLTLSGVMTFFFGDIYFQYHLNEIMRKKRALSLGAVSV